MNKFKFLIFILCVFFAPLNVLAQTEEISPILSSEIPSETSQILPYNYLSTYSIPIKLAIIEPYTTQEPLNEGSTLKFKVLEDVYHNEKLIVKAGDEINGKLETNITAGMNGFPAEIIIDDFEIPNINKSQLQSTYVKKGRNRCFWVYPLKWALTPIPFVGSLTNLIKGGHAQIKTTDTITIYYYPEWR